MSLSWMLWRSEKPRRRGYVRRNTVFIEEEVLSKGGEELSYKDGLALERAVQKVVESMLDIRRQLVSIYSLGFAESYGQYPEKLAEAKRMPKGLMKMKCLTL